MNNIIKLLDRASVIMKECEDIASGKAICDYKGNIIGYKEERYLSNCCSANPIGELDESREAVLGHCSQCGDGAIFIEE